MQEEPKVQEPTLASPPETPGSSPPLAASNTPPYPSTSDRLRAFQNTTLQFLSNASNETLGACAVGLAASTYLVLGRIGLVLIGAVGGVVLHANWEAQGGYAAGDGQSAAQEGQRRRKELGLEVVKRALDWRGKSNIPPETDDADDVLTKSATLTAKQLDFSDFQPETQAALTSLTDAVIRDYVKWWYQPLLPAEQSFPTACRQVLTGFIRTFSSHLSRKRAADPVLDFLANSTSIIIVFLNELATALKASQRQDPQDAIRTYLQYQPESSLANVLSSNQQEKKLSIVADDILQNFLDVPSYNCPPVKAFLREVLSGLILQPMIEGQAKADSINAWIVYLLEDGEPELMNVIDAGVEGATGKPTSPTKQESRHQRRVSRAEEAMEQAIKEAERLNAMIAEDETRRNQGLNTPDTEGVSSSTTTETGLATPTSSDSDPNRGHERSRSASYLLDAEGNAIQSATPNTMKDPAPPMSMGQYSESEEDLLPQQPTDIPPSPAEVMVAVPLTLHNAFITMIDMGEGDDRVIMKKEPWQSEFLVQIEPASSRFPGWVITRRYADFSKLHERLFILARVSGVPQFTQHHSEVPTWKGIPRRTLRSDLELYLRNALKYEPLAESEAMKKFLEKETGIAKAPAQNKNVLVQGGAALENVGKNFVNVLGQGGKGIAGGGKAVFGGVQGAFGAITAGVGGPKKLVTPQKTVQTSARVNAASVASPSRPSQDVPRFSVDVDSGKAPPLPARLTRMSSDHSQLTSSREESPIRRSEESLNLPPPPSAISDEYSPVAVATPLRQPSRPESPQPLTPTSSILPAVDSPSASKILNPPAKPQRQNAPITEEETRVSVELMFAIITELYSLSSAWTIRLSLLSAAKTFLLRPQNPQLESIRLLLQESALEANFSHKGLAAHVNKLRENSLPTDEERAKWPKELTLEESKKLRIKARKLLVERGIPQALTSVMGQQASGEALGKVFDCLQIEEVARGLIFALLLQALRAATQ